MFSLYKTVQWWLREVKKEAKMQYSFEFLRLSHSLVTHSGKRLRKMLQNFLLATHALSPQLSLQHVSLLLVPLVSLFYGYFASSSLCHKRSPCVCTYVLMCVCSGVESKSVIQCCKSITVWVFVCLCI